MQNAICKISIGSTIVHFKVDFLRFRHHILYAKSTVQVYSKTCVKRPLSKGPKIGFHD